MKYEIKKIIRIDCELDSSEGVMLTKGGLHHVKIPLNGHEWEDETPLDISKFDEILFTIKMVDVSRFDFVTKRGTPPTESYSMPTSSEDSLTSP